MEINQGARKENSSLPATLTLTHYLMTAKGLGKHKNANYTECRQSLCCCNTRESTDGWHQEVGTYTENKKLGRKGNKNIHVYRFNKVCLNLI